MIITKNTLSKAAIVSASVVVALAFSSVAHAQTSVSSTMMPSTMTTAQLQSQLATLQAELSAQQGGGTSMMVTPPMFESNLTLGSTGSSVISLQTWLIAKGYSIPAGPTGHFGAQTQAALASYQSANGIWPAVGYFGPTTRAHVNAASTGGMMTTGTSMVSGCNAGAAYSTTTGQSCGPVSSTSFSTTSSLDGQMSAILGQEGGLSNDLTQTENVSGQSDTGGQ